MIEHCSLIQNHCGHAWMLFCIYISFIRCFVIQQKFYTNPRNGILNFKRKCETCCINEAQVLNEIPSPIFIDLKRLCNHVLRRPCMHAFISVIYFLVEFCAFTWGIIQVRNFLDYGIQLLELTLVKCWVYGWNVEL